MTWFGLCTLQLGRVTGSARKLHPISSSGEESAGHSLPLPHGRVLGCPQKGYVWWWMASKTLWQTARLNQAQGLQSSCQNHQKTVSNCQRSNAPMRRMQMMGDSSLARLHQICQYLRQFWSDLENSFLAKSQIEWTFDFLQKMPWLKEYNPCNWVPKTRAIFIDAKVSLPRSNRPWYDRQDEEVPTGSYCIHFYSVRVGMILVADVHYGGKTFSLELGSEWVSERASEWAQRNARV